MGISSFTASVVLRFGSSETAIILHSSDSIRLPELTFTAHLNGSVQEGITFDQLFPISLAIEQTADKSSEQLKNGRETTVDARFEISTCVKWPGCRGDNCTKDTCPDTCPANHTIDTIDDSPSTFMFASS